MDGQVWLTMERWKSLAVVGAFFQCHRFHRKSCTGVLFIRVNTILGYTKLRVLHSQWHVQVHASMLLLMSNAHVQWCMHRILYACMRSLVWKNLQQWIMATSRMHESIPQSADKFLYKGLYLAYLHNFCNWYPCILYAVENKTIKCDTHFSMNVHKIAHMKNEICKI